MPIKNQIINYFAVLPVETNTPRVFRASVTMSVESAKQILEQQFRNKNEKFTAKKILHVCFDTDSKIVYVPNASSFQEHEMKKLLMAAEYKITKDFGDFSGIKEVFGSPFSLIRIRSIDSFAYASKHIPENTQEIKNIPIIEVNLLRMPSVLNNLPSIFKNDLYAGGYVGGNSTIKFIEEIDINGNKIEPREILEKQTPFILINIGSKSKIDYTLKEQIVLTGIKEYIADKSKSIGISKQEEQEINLNLVSNKIRHFMYLGWPFEDVCSAMLSNINDIGILFTTSNLLLNTVKDLKGNSTEFSHPYYSTFKINKKTFPIDIESVSTDGEIDTSKQIDIFKIIDYDDNNKKILIETKMFLPAHIFKRLFNAISEPIITRYNKSMNVIDIKSDPNVYSNIMGSDPLQMQKIKALIKYDLKDEDIPNKNKIQMRLIDPSDIKNSFSIRNLSEYFYAVDNIKKICSKYNQEFKDLQVVIGPIEYLFGEGTLGGFMGEKEFRLNKMKIPYEIIPNSGIYVSPPVIFINSKKKQTPSEQTEILIHEYSHNLYSLTNPNHHAEYITESVKNPSLKNKDPDRYWFLYLTDPDERQAHKNHMKFQLNSGLSEDEIIRNNFGEIKIDNYGRAMKFKELLQEAVDEIEQENKTPDTPA